MAWDDVKASGNDILSADWNSMATDQKSRSPIGSVISWLKNYTNTPSLPTGWVECNGQTLSDVGSVYNGQIIPNLNGVIGTTHNVDFTNPTYAFDKNSSTSATYTSTSTTSRYVGHTFSLRYVKRVRVKFASSSWSSVSAKLQTYNGSTWSDVGSPYTSNIDLDIEINSSIAGLRIYFTPTTTLSRTFSVFQLDIEAYFLMGRDTSGIMEGTSRHTHSFSGTAGADQLSSGNMRIIATNVVDIPDSNFSDNIPPYYSVIWIMRVK